MRNKTILVTLIVCAIVSFTSCVNYKFAKLTELTKKDGKQFLTIDTLGITIEFYGDYLFHRPNPRKYPSLKSDYFKQLTRNKNATIFFSNHTTIEPFGSSIGVLYKELTTNAIVNQIKSHSGVTSILEDSVLINKNEIHRFIYMIDDVQFIDYFLYQKNATLRFHFWSNNPNLIWLNNESKAIIETLTIP